MKKLAHREDCGIDRSDDNFPCQAVLYDSEGEKLFVFPGSFTDAQIMFALAFANQAYRIGYDTGAEMKTIEIKNALDISITG